MVKPNFIITATSREKEEVFAQTYEQRKIKDPRKLKRYNNQKRELDYIDCQNNQRQIHSNKFRIRKFETQTEYTYHVSEWEILRESEIHLFILAKPEFVPIVVVKNKAFEPDSQKHLVEYIKDSKGGCRLYIGFLDKKIDRFGGEYPSETLCNSCAKEFDTCKTKPKFLGDHPILVPKNDADFDLVYDCDGYEERR